MKTQIQKIIGLLTISSLLFVSCENVDFGDENLNPNAISKANTGALITSAMRNLPGLVSSVNPLLLSQQVLRLHIMKTHVMKQSSGTSTVFILVH